MKADAKRQPGFYWVRFEGLVMVAEYTRRKLWWFPGINARYKDSEICELLSPRLEPPKPKDRK